MLFIAVTIALSFLAIYLIWLLSTNNFNYWKKRGVKYPKPVPFFGNLLPTILKQLSSADFTKGLYNTFPGERYYGIFQFFTPTLIVKDLELIKQITIKNFENFVDHAGLGSPENDPFFSKNIFSSQGERWRDLRQSLSPLFTGSKMRWMYVLMDDSVKHFTKHFRDQNKDIIPVEMKDVATKLTNDIIANTAFGVQCDTLQSPDNEFYASGRDFGEMTGLKRLKFFVCANLPFLSKLFNLRFLSQKTEDFFKSVISKNLKQREEKNVTRPDLIHLLMMARKGKLSLEENSDVSETGFAVAKEFQEGKVISDNFLTDEDIAAQALIFFLGGFDTVSTLMSFVCYELAINPEVQDKLRREIQNVNEDCHEKVAYEDIVKIKYLDMVISETLRKWPAGIFMDRKCTKSFEIPPLNQNENPLKIDVGTIIWIPVIGIHYDPKYYQNPDVFDPERFNDENKSKILPGTYLPFGSGPRNCIGSRFALLEVKIFLFRLLVDFEVVPTEKTKVPLRTSKDNFLLSADGGFNLALKRLNN